MRTRTHKRKPSNLLIIPVLAVVLIISFIAIYYGLGSINSTVNGTDNSKSITLNTNKLEEKSIYSEHAVLTDVETGKTLYDKNGDERCYPASLTKIMTAITAIENNNDLEQTTSLDNTTLANLTVDNASMAGYYAGEKTTIEDMLYGCLLASGADASIGLAKATSGSVDDFINLMNEKAEKIGMDNTNFTNVTGLHDEDHYTTAKDMSTLMEYVLKNPTFKEIFSTQSHNIVTDTREFTVSSTFYSEYKGDVKDVKVKGAKTGTTSSAGCCLASLVELDGREYILITTKAPIGGSNQPFSFDDLDYIFDTI